MVKMHVRGFIQNCFYIFFFNLRNKIIIYSQDKDLKHVTHLSTVFFSKGEKWHYNHTKALKNHSDFMNI